MNSPHKWPVTRQMFSFDDVIMYRTFFLCVCVKYQKNRVKVHQFFQCHNPNDRIIWLWHCARRLWKSLHRPLSGLFGDLDQFHGLFFSVIIQIWWKFVFLTYKLWANISNNLIFTDLDSDTLISFWIWISNVDLWVKWALLWEFYFSGEPWRVKLLRKMEHCMVFHGECYVKTWFDIYLW